MKSTLRRRNGAWVTLTVLRSSTPSTARRRKNCTTSRRSSQEEGHDAEEARKKVEDPLYYGCMIIKSGDADGQLAGARNTTGDVLRPALQIMARLLPALLA